jgi:hypothetical protein
VRQVTDYAAGSRQRVATSLRSIKSRDEMYDSQASPWWICSHTAQAGDAAAEGATLKSNEWLKPEEEWWGVRQEVNGILDAGIAKYLGR